MNAIKLMADYGCWPLWDMTPGEYGNVDPADVPISAIAAGAARRMGCDVRRDPERGGSRGVRVRQPG